VVSIREPYRPVPNAAGFRKFHTMLCLDVVGFDGMDVSELIRHFSGTATKGRLPCRICDPNPMARQGSGIWERGCPPVNPCRNGHEQTPTHPAVVQKTGSIIGLQLP